MKKQSRILIYLLLASFVITTWLFWRYERGVNESITSIWDVFWWWIVTSTTVGYGDISPVTLQGRIAGTFTIIIGIYCYTNFITLTAEKLHEVVNRDRFGTAKINFKNHIVICEYTAFADELLQVIPHYAEFRNRKVVVISDLVGVNPYPEFYFVHGVPISPVALQQANVQAADYIFVFANTRFKEPDLKTLHTVSRIQKLNSHAKIFVEMTNPSADFVEYLAGKITILESRHLLELVLKHKALDLSAYFSTTPAVQSAEQKA
ncbi:MAG: ion channel [Anaerolineae bacterium]|nr:ion channel [Anaerolineae bacterium]